MESFLHHFESDRGRFPLSGVRRGFTLVELLVVTAIIIVVTGVIFSGQANFSSTVLLANTAYDVALTARNAETYGLGTRAAGGSANAGYGLDFSAGAPASYTLFVDRAPAPGSPGACHPLPVNGAGAPDAYPGDCVYGAGDTAVSTYTLGNGMTIGAFCAYDGAWRCSTDASSPLTQFDIIYIRPNAAPFMSENGAYSASPAVTSACVSVRSPQGASRFISFSSFGQVVGNAASCP